MHLGLIGGIGPAATEFYYRQLVTASVERGRRLDLTIVHADIGEMLRNLVATDRVAQANVFRGLAARLHAAGADRVAITSMAGHFCVREFEPVSPLPVVNAIDAVRAELTRRQISAVGMLGTRAVMESQLFGGLSDFTVKLPQGEDLVTTDREYIAMARAGRATDEQRAFFFRMGRALHEAGAQVVLLAGTDLFLAFDGRESGVSTIDCATVHVEALARLAFASAP
jgi:aspartate racemase